MKLTRKICLLASLALIGGILLAGCGPKTEPGPTGENPTLSGDKHPSQYTWEEYMALSEEQKEAFRKSFRSEDIFNQWMEQAQADDGPALPWEQGGKAPSAYSWAEFEALSGEQQIAFQNAFENFEAFDAWLRAHEPTEPGLVIPWENGGKAPGEYTWAEFEALSGELQMAFQEAFASFEAFEEWMMLSQRYGEAGLPWEQGGKQPVDYTWAEFEALSGEQQIAFQEAFGDFEAFDAWLRASQPTEPGLVIPWEQGGKQPVDYTWAEFEALSGELQVAFQDSFEHFEDFEAWMNRVNP